MIDFTGRTALVTGGTRGIGEAIVRHLSDLGAQVIATGTSEGSVSGAADRTRSEGTEIRYEVVDFLDSQSTEAFAKRMAEEDVDVLVNNAGINRIAVTGDVDMDDWDDIQRVNLRAPMVLIRALAPGMAERAYGRIVNVSSIFGHVTRRKRVSYTTSKFGLLGLTRTAAVDYARRNVLVNALGPGFIDTELTREILSEEQRAELAEATPMGRMGGVDEIARALLFLASEANTFMTGQLILVDGGFTSV